MSSIPRISLYRISFHPNGVSMPGVSEVGVGVADFLLESGDHLTTESGYAILNENQD